MVRLVGAEREQRQARSCARGRPRRRPRAGLALPSCPAHGEPGRARRPGRRRWQRGRGPAPAPAARWRAWPCPEARPSPRGRRGTPRGDRASGFVCTGQPGAPRRTARAAGVGSATKADADPWAARRASSPRRSPDRGRGPGGGRRAGPACAAPASSATSVPALRRMPDLPTRSARRPPGWSDRWGALTSRPTTMSTGGRRGWPPASLGRWDAAAGARGGAQGGVAAAAGQTTGPPTRAAGRSTRPGATRQDRPGAVHRIGCRGHRS